MESVAPPLSLIHRVQFALQSGESLRTELARYCAERPDGFAIHVSKWLFQCEHGGDTRALIESAGSPYRSALLMTLESGLKGFPVLERLAQLESEVKEAQEAELDTFLAVLPFRLMIPLFFLQLPALLILMLGPLVLEFLAEMGT